MNPILKNSKGQSLIESLISLACLSALLSSCLVFLYLAFAKIWLHYSAHECLICVASNKSAYECEQEFRHKIHPSLFWGRIMKFQINQNLSEAHLKVKYSIGFQTNEKDFFHLFEDQKMNLNIVD